MHELFFLEECLEAVVDNHQHQNEKQGKGQAQSKPQQQENLCLPKDIKFPGSESEGSSLEKAFSKEQLEEANYA